jgi:hypothetical protein
VLAVNAWDEPKEMLTKFVKDKNLKHTILLSGEKVATETYGLKGVPYVFWINKEGVVVDSEMDYDGPEPLERRTKKLLGS